MWLVFTLPLLLLLRLVLLVLSLTLCILGVRTSQVPLQELISPGSCIGSHSHALSAAEAWYAIPLPATPAPSMNRGEKEKKRKRTRQLQASYCKEHVREVWLVAGEGIPLPECDKFSPEAPVVALSHQG